MQLSLIHQLKKRLGNACEKLLLLGKELIFLGFFFFFFCFVLLFSFSLVSSERNVGSAYNELGLDQTLFKEKPEIPGKDFVPFVCFSVEDAH